MYIIAVAVLVELFKWHQRLTFSLVVCIFIKIMKTVSDLRRQCSDQFRCHGSPVCIPLDHVCNNEIDCPEADDEMLCDLHCPVTCVCHALSAKCQNVTVVEDLFDNTTTSVIFRKLDLSHNRLDQALLSFHKLHYLTELLLSQCHITDVPSLLFAPLQNLLTLDISFNKIKVLKSNMFDGLSRLENILLIGNPIEFIENDAFVGLSGLHEVDLSGSKLKLIRPGIFEGLTNIALLNLSYNLIEIVLDDSFQYLGKLNKLDLQSNKITSFQAGIFNSLDSLTALYTDSFTFCCVRPDTVTESNCYPQPNEFSSCEDLMRQDVLRAFLWIIGLLALTGNVSVLMIRLYFQRETLVKTYGMFVTNLGIADLMMGLYLIILAIADAFFRGEYVWNDHQWRHGLTCNIAGVLSTLASEGSVIFLCWITLDRLLVVKFPFGRFRISRNKAIAACTGSWIVLFCIALIPFVLPSYFESRFYSRSAVCLALPLTRDRPAGWEYSVGVFIVFNFVTILLIAVAQIVIYHEIFSSASRITSNKRKQDVTIARNLFLIVFTNFMCLFPVGIMGKFT